MKMNVEKNKYELEERLKLKRMTMVIQKPTTSAKFSNTDAFAKIIQK